MQNLEHIRMLVLSADLGSFSACARRLGKAQSAVSHAISSLEIDLDVELFDRSTRKPMLTPAGERLYRSAKALLAQSEEFVQMAKAINQQEESNLRIVLDDALMTPAVASVLATFCHKFPYTQLDIQTHPSPDIIPLLLNNQASFGIMVSEISAIKEVDFCYIGQIPMVPICHPDHELARRESINEPDLYPYRQIAIRGSQQLESPMLMSVTPNVWWCSSTLNALTLVKQGIGWSYLPLYLAQPYIDKKELIKLDVSFDHQTWQAPIDIVWPRGLTKGPALTWLQNELKRVMLKDQCLS